MMGATVSGAPTGAQPNGRDLQFASRIAGGAYLITMASGIFAESFVRGSLVVRGDAAQTAQNISASSQLFRIGMAADLLTFTGVIVLIWALYLLLRQVNERLALLALLFRIVEASVHYVAMLGSAGALVLLSQVAYVDAVAQPEREVLARVAIAIQGAGINFGFILLGLGSAVYALLFLRSRIVPRPLAALGIAASMLLALSSAWYVIDPRIAPVRLALMAPMFVYEVGLGIVLLTGLGRRLKAPL